MMTFAPELTGLTHLFDVVSWEDGSETYDELYNNFAMWDKILHACKVGSDHIAVFRGYEDVEIDLIKISTGELVDRYFDSTGAMGLLKTFGSDVYTGYPPDRTNRIVEFDTFSVIFAMGTWGQFILNLLSVDNDSLVLHSIEVFDANDSVDPVNFPTMFPWFDHTPPTLVRTGASQVTLVTGDYVFGTGVDYFIAMDADVTATSATRTATRITPMYPDLSPRANPVVSFFDPTLTEHREIKFLSQTTPQIEGNSQSRDFYATTFHTGTGDVSSKLIAEYPDLHPFRYHWRVMTTPGKYIAFTDDQATSSWADNLPGSDGGWLYVYDEVTDDLITKKKIEPEPWHDRPFPYGTVAHTQWYGHHDHVYVIGNNYSGFPRYLHLAEYNVSGSEPSLVTVHQLPGNPRDPSLGESGRRDWAFAQVVGNNNQYLVVGYMGWGYDDVGGWEDWSPVYSIYEREFAPEFIGGKLIESMLTFAP